MFTWDPLKAASNLAKHGVSFEEATTVFADPNAQIREDPSHSATELRRLLIGSSNNNRVLLIAYTIRTDNDAQITRIITARPASRKEIEAAARQRNRFF
jgi:uncharacterized DUF497 family protein